MQPPVGHQHSMAQGVDGPDVLAQGHRVEAPPGTVGRLYPGVHHQVDMAVGVALPGRQVRDPGRLQLQAALLHLRPSPPRPGDCHPGQVPAYLVSLAVHDPLQGRCHHRVLGGQHRQALGVVDHHLHEPQRRPLRASRADNAFYFSGSQVPSFHPRLQLSPTGQHRAREAFPAPPGVHLDGGLVALGVVGLGPAVALLEVPGCAGARTAVEVHAAFHRVSPGPASTAPAHGDLPPWTALMMVSWRFAPGPWSAHNPALVVARR